MAAFSRKAQNFLTTYADRFDAFEKAAKLIEAEVKRIVSDTGAFVQIISARAKTVSSLRKKLRDKRYARPAQQVTDLIGIRVITYYRDAVDPIAARLRQEFDFNAKESVDKRLELGLGEFGYRSVHVIARVKPKQLLSLDDKFIRKRWFEIQVRSIVEHAWAEIEHEVVYKSGIAFPDATRRRFASLAGALELLDAEFLALRDSRIGLIDHYRQRYEQNRDQRTTFDVARLWAFLEIMWPEGRSWRQARDEGVPFHPGLDVSCVQALKSVGLGTPASLGKVVRSRSFRRALAEFSADSGIAPAQVSHVALVLLAVATRNLPMMQRHFPEFMNDPSLAPILASRSQVRGGQRSRRLQSQ